MMTVSQYLKSGYFREDHPHRMWAILFALAGLAILTKFALPPGDVRLEVRTFADLVAVVASYGALLLFGLSFVAMHYARQALGEIGVNLAIARWVEASAQKKLEAIRQDPRVRGEVSKLESEHLPDNSSNPKPAALRLFQRICREASDRRFESTINLIEPYQRESMEPIFRLEGVQRNALRGGILCHFIGLVIVINSVPAMLTRSAQRTAQFVPQTVAAPNSPSPEAPSDSTNAAIAPILDGLRLAFGASVGGLAVSLFAAMLLSEVRKKQFAYFRKLDEATSTMISLASNSLNNDELLSSLTAVTKRLEEQTEAVRTGVTQVAATISEQAKIIAAGLKDLGDGRTRLDGFLKGVSDSHDEFLQRLNTYYDVGTIGTLVNGSEVRLAKSIHDSGATLSAAAGSVSSTVRQVQADLKDVRGMVSTINETATMHLGGKVFPMVPYIMLVIAGASVFNLILYLAR
jgi:hypothetical protein